MLTIPKNADRFELRRAAGLYWLVDLEQKGSTYHETMKLNEKGARIWSLMNEGKSYEEIAGLLSKESGEGQQRTYLSVLRLAEALKEYGVILEEVNS